ALAHEPRVHPGPDHLPAPARAELLQLGRGPGREAGGMARRRVGRSRRPRAGRVDPPRPHLAVLPRGLHSPRDLGHAWHGGGGGGARVRHHGADDPGGYPRPQIAGSLRGHLPPRGTAPHQHRSRHRSRGAAVPLAASAALRLVILDLARLTWTFLWLSLICVGGGLGVIPELQRQVVDRFHWVTAREVLDGYTLSQLTPGPTMLVSVFVGYRAHGVPRAVLSAAAMFRPPAVITAIITRHWATLRDRPWARATERALAPVGIGLMAAGVYTLARTGVHDWASAALALMAGGVMFVRRFPPVLAVVVAGLIGWLPAFCGARPCHGHTLPLCSPSRRLHPRAQGADTIATSTVATALGPVATTALGPTLMHEHIVTRSPGVHENWPHLFDRPGILASAERKMADLYARGIRTIVD